MFKKGVGRGGGACKHGISATGHCARKSSGRNRKEAMLARWAALRAAGKHRRGPTGKSCKHGTLGNGYCRKRKLSKKSIFMP